LPVTRTIKTAFSASYATLNIPQHIIYFIQTDRRKTESKQLDKEMDTQILEINLKCKSISECPFYVSNSFAYKKFCFTKTVNLTEYQRKQIPTCSSQSASISRNVVCKNDGPHARLSGPTLAHQQNLNKNQLSPSASAMRQLATMICKYQDAKGTRHNIVQSLIQSHKRACLCDSTRHMLDMNSWWYCPCSTPRHAE